MTARVGHGQSKCDIVSYKFNPASCHLTVAKKVNDTIITFLPKNCNVYNFDSTANGQWKIYSSDTTTLLEIVTIKSGKRQGTEIKFYSNGKIESKYDNNTGYYISFESNGKLSEEGYYKKQIVNDGHDTINVLDGTRFWYWDNGNIACKVILKDGKYNKEMHWDKDGNIIDKQKFQKLWFDCK